MPAVKLVSSLDGPEDAPVLVLGNPIGTTRDVWAHQVPVLSRYFRVLRYEPRGHGAPGAQSPAPPGPYTIADLGSDVLAVADARGIERFAYAGVSLGGMTGIWLAANAPRADHLPRRLLRRPHRDAEPAGLARPRRPRPRRGHGAAGGPGGPALVHPRVHGPRARGGADRGRHAQGDQPRGLRRLRRGHRRARPPPAARLGAGPDPRRCPARKTSPRRPRSAPTPPAASRAPG